MNTSSQNQTPPPVHETPVQTVDPVRLARAVRFFLCLVVVGISFFSIVLGMRINRFEEIFHDLYEDKPLPALTVFVVHAQPALMTFSFLVVAVAVATLFSRRVVGCLYFLGGLAMSVIAEALVIYFALSAPLVQIISNLSGNPSP